MRQSEDNCGIYFSKFEKMFKILGSPLENWNSS